MSKKDNELESTIFIESSRITDVNLSPGMNSQLSGTPNAQYVLYAFNQSNQLEAYVAAQNPSHQTPLKFSAGGKIDPGRSTSVEFQMNTKGKISVINFTSISRGLNPVIRFVLIPLS